MVPDPPPPASTFFASAQAAAGADEPVVGDAGAAAASPAGAGAPSADAALRRLQGAGAGLAGSDDAVVATGSQLAAIISAATTAATKAATSMLMKAQGGRRKATRTRSTAAGGVDLDSEAAPPSHAASPLKRQASAPGSVAGPDGASAREFGADLSNAAQVVQPASGAQQFQSLAQPGRPWNLFLCVSCCFTMVLAAVSVAFSRCSATKCRALFGVPLPRCAAMLTLIPALLRYAYVDMASFPPPLFARHGILASCFATGQRRAGRYCRQPGSRAPAAGRRHGHASRLRAQVPLPTHRERRRRHCRCWRWRDRQRWRRSQRRCGCGCAAASRRGRPALGRPASGPRLARYRSRAGLNTAPLPAYRSARCW